MRSSNCAVYSPVMICPLAKRYAMVVCFHYPSENFLSDFGRDSSKERTGSLRIDSRVDPNCEYMFLIGHLPLLSMMRREKAGVPVLEAAMAILQCTCRSSWAI